MECFPVIISSPSGGGKTTITQRLLRGDKTLSRVITATTRAPRKGEKNGHDYHFWPVQRFESAVKNNLMAEWAKVHADYYGVPKSSINSVTKKGKHPVLVIDVQGAKTLKKLYKNAVLIFIAPPGLAELKKRIAARGDGTKNVALRLKTAQKEMLQAKYYNYKVTNKILNDAVSDCRAIIKAERLKIRRK